MRNVSRDLRRDGWIGFIWLRTGMNRKQMTMSFHNRTRCEAAPRGRLSLRALRKSWVGSNAAESS
jgi:hypothetical protein